MYLAWLRFCTVIQVLITNNALYLQSAVWGLISAAGNIWSTIRKPTLLCVNYSSWLQTKDSWTSMASVFILTITFANVTSFDQLQKLLQFTL